MAHFNKYFSDPAVVEHDFVVLKYFWHTTNGLYIWEYLTTLDFELDIIRRRRPYRWTIWIYSLTRMSTLMAVIINFAFDSTTPINCQVWNTLLLTFGYLGLVTASVLIIFRIVAIWNKNKLVVGTAIIVCVINVLVIIIGIVQTRSSWDPVRQGCIVLNTEKSKPSIIVTLVNKIVLLLIVLIGLLRLFYDGVGSFPLGRLLWKQGVIWLLIATLAGIPPVVFIVLNLNGSLNLMFQLPSVIALSIAATRVYRNLSEFVYGSTDIYQIRDGKIMKTSGKSSASTLPNQIEVNVDTSCGRHSAEQSIISMDGQLSDNLHGSSLSVDSDLERGIKNPVPQ